MTRQRQWSRKQSAHRTRFPMAYKFSAILVLAGDLNIWRGYGGKKWEPGYRSVFDRLEAYGIRLAGPHRTVGSPLPECPCKDGEDCSHVRTYRHGRRQDSRPLQLDFVF